MNSSAWRIGTPLLALVQSSGSLQEVLKDDLTIGDTVYVLTRNSTYSIECVSKGVFVVIGGWFDQNGRSPTVTTVVGCTWGGTAIKTNTFAAEGLCLEFGNRVTTTPIRKILKVSHAQRN